MAREFRFPVDVEWAGGRRTVSLVEDKEPLVVATPREFFREADPTLWSPEDLFVSSAASCLAVTVVALAEREGLPVRSLDVHAEGVVGRRGDGSFGFVRIEQDVELETEPGHEHAARELVDRAEQGCLVSVSLALPVATTVTVRTPEPAVRP